MSNELADDDAEGYAGKELRRPFPPTAGLVHSEKRLHRVQLYRHHACLQLFPQALQPIHSH